MHIQNDCRMRGTLPALVQDNHAFIEGRYIAHNDMLCQDLIEVYKRKHISPGFCSRLMKKRLWHISWDFINVSLNSSDSLLNFANGLWILSIIAASLCQPMVKLMSILTARKYWSRETLFFTYFCDSYGVLDLNTSSQGSTYSIQIPPYNLYKSLWLLYLCCS